MFRALEDDPKAHEAKLDTECPRLVAEICWSNDESVARVPIER